ncbi:MAG: glycoside hydrolase family 32 protein [Magnetospirillum sp.]|nr:glycoside hydrolase family 32 protein [Magnetospirillum sp.]
MANFPERPSGPLLFFLPGDPHTRVASSDRPTPDGKSAEGSLCSPDFVIERDFINLQLAGGDHAYRASATLWIGGRVVRTSTGGNRTELGWVTWDVRDFKGLTASIGLHDYCREDRLPYIAAGRIEASDGAKTDATGDVASANAAVRQQAVDAIRRNVPRAVADPYRPIYHYTPPAQRMNDPNGPAWFNGYHHVFYQHMVFIEHGVATNVHWGHARSRDLVNWETLPLAVHPEYELGELSCFSGNLAWDKNGEPVQFVTMVPFKKETARQIWPSRPVDAEWIRWERTAEKPPHGLVPQGEPAVRHLKDAFPFSAGNRRFLVLTDKNIPIYEALDDQLTTWQYRGTIDPESAECPNFFEVDGRWVYLSSPHEPVRYQIGDFDPVTAKFVPRTEGRISHDSGFYASTAYRDDQGRTILNGVTRGQRSGRGWTGALALPRILTIGSDDRPRMFPAPELEKLRRDAVRWTEPVTLHNRVMVLPGLTGDALEIIARFRVNDATSFGLQVRRSEDGTRFLPVKWANGEITVARPTPKFPCRYEIDPETREVTFRVFLDKGILDACTGDGRVFESRVHYAPLTDLQIAVFAEGGEATLVSFEAWQMAPAAIDHSQLLGKQ